MSGFEHLTPSMQRRVHALQRYTRALEIGDIDSLASILQEAERDRALESMILELHASYQENHLLEPVAVELESLPDQLFSQSDSPIELTHSGSRSISTSRPHTGVARGRSSKPDERISRMKFTKERSISDLNEDQKPRPIARLKRGFQMLAAILVISILGGGFMLLFAARQSNSGPASPPTTEQKQTNVDKKLKGILVLVDRGNVYGLHPVTGEIVWTFEFQPDPYGQASAVTVQNKIVYFVHACQLYAINAIDGSQIWHQNLRSEGVFECNYGSIALDQDVVLVGGYRMYGDKPPQLDGSSPLETRSHVHVLNARDGSSIWESEDYDLLATSVFTADDGVLYVEKKVDDGSGPLVALDVRSGQLRWEDERSKVDYPITVTSVDNVVYMLSMPVHDYSDGSKTPVRVLSALKSEDGSLLWSIDVVVSGISPIAVVQKYAVVIERLPVENGIGFVFRVCAYHINDGEQAWCTENEPDVFSTSERYFVTTQNMLYASYNGKISALDANNGKVLWRINTATPVVKQSATIVGYGESIYYSGVRRIVAINTKDGSELWSAPYRGVLALELW